MKDNAHTIPAGYSSIAPGHIASVVTCLEMREKPAGAPVPLPEGFTLQPLTHRDPDAYRSLFRKVGADWLWFSRLMMSDETLISVLQNSSREIYVIHHNDRDAGLMELDFSEPGEVELVFLGLTPDVTGKGIGRAVMSAATELAWAKPVQRFWVHTCTFDHPSALGFYIRSGFKPYARRVEVQADPRLSGHLPLDAAPHVPLLSA
ncbi:MULTISPECIES: GNAT family N-acetyltransferase [Enterobacteriaceae]|jgi:GNAT superfamily N-acetyltransferase|uniref:GNAT family N-acetyltransferase n=1 Tax=Enterobacteriaceae TaxID=543 RepID=UPI000E8D9E3F|nr:MULTISPECIES: GNAT family N-acetyltransferase [Enterobacteriaceae]MDF2777144.1 family acetyltransferase [Enterobacteriaceae bacterium]WPO93459.1 GNAT family N-acetyltransferase [Buttiauxella sp. HR94]HAZ78214.1 GNAT family N-acetyltransferase [Enterobacteriaceae bacterium]